MICDKMAARVFKTEASDVRLNRGTIRWEVVLEAAEMRTIRISHSEGPK